jgi:hypothetical protein
MCDSRRTPHDRLERNRERVARLRQRRGRKRRWFYGDEELHAGRALGTLVFVDGRIVIVVPGMRDRGVPAQVRVHPRHAVMIVVVVVHVRVQQGRTKGRQLKSDGRRHGSDRAKQPGYCKPE